MNASSMQYRRFGATDLQVSTIGFGAWAIGGPSRVGTTPIGWGTTDDATSRQALRKALDLGIRFFDTADFYGLGHSEDLIGEVVGSRRDVVIATKVGHRAGGDGTILLDYSQKHILSACEQSLRRLRRDSIDIYQLHSARLSHLEQRECIEAMERLMEQGKVRYWGISLNTFHPEAEARYLMDRKLGHSFQLVLNIINQRAVPLLTEASAKGYGIIVRMPFQFGLLTGKFTPDTRFAQDDHRSFRLTPQVLGTALKALADVWPLAARREISPATLSLGFCASFPSVSTIIPGIRTPEQAEQNARVISLPDSDISFLRGLYERHVAELMDLMERQG